MRRGSEGAFVMAGAPILVGVRRLMDRRIHRTDSQALRRGHPAHGKQGARHQGDERGMPCEAENPLHVWLLDRVHQRVKMPGVAAHTRHLLKGGGWRTRY